MSRISNVYGRVAHLWVPEWASAKYKKSKERGGMDRAILKVQGDEEEVRGRI